MRPGSYDPATAALELGPLTANARGGKNASVAINGKPLRFQLKHCTTPFECQGYGGGLPAFATALDAKVLAEAAKLGLKESGFKPLLKESKSGTYAPTFRQKITISEETGRSGCIF